jgi:hypothetical protein
MASAYGEWTVQTTHPETGRRKWHEAGGREFNPLRQHHSPSLSPLDHWGLRLVAVYELEHSGVRLKTTHPQSSGELSPPKLDAIQATASCAASRAMNAWPTPFIISNWILLPR